MSMGCSALLCAASVALFGSCSQIRFISSPLSSHSTPSSPSSFSPSSSRPAENSEQESKSKDDKKLTSPSQKLHQYCYQALKGLPGKHNPKELRNVCAQVAVRENCRSHKGRPIFHYEKQAARGGRGLRILAIALVHGDEFPSGSVARSWMERLNNLDPRSTWRIIPVANPDGLALKTRTNARKVDINRNFPTKNWQKLAVKMWKKRYKSTWRKYPGTAPGSERETKCLMGHFEDFRSDFIISVHTPLGHLDFDGPKTKYPSYNLLPWRRFGHFPGSLGRYMWRDHKVPVLTIELKGNTPVKSLKILDNLQDISGTLALKAVDSSPSIPPKDLTGELSLE